jgi:LPS sulfotransferase NodH
VTVPFALLTTQRTGSSWLTTLLDSHPEADAYGELFLAAEDSRPPWGAQTMDRFGSFRSAAPGRGQRSGRPGVTFAYLDRLFASNPTVRAIGFKLMYDQAARHPEALVYCLRKGARVIHLVRTNVLDVLISRELMLARDTPHATAERELTAVRVVLEPDTIRRRLHALEAQTAFFRQLLRVLRFRHIEVRYDTLVSDPDAIQPVLRFLDLPADTALHSPLVKISDGKQSELVENYDAVAHALRRTRFASLLTG